MSALSGQYATALFQLALEQDTLDDVQTSLETFLQGISTEDEILFLHPKITKKQKKDIIESMPINQMVKDFLRVVIDNNRFEHLKAMMNDYQLLVENQGQVMRITVFSGKPLATEKMTRLKTEYEKKYNRQVVIENNVESSIVGGLRFEFDGKVIDDTINYTLNQLKNRLAQ